MLEKYSKREYDRRHYLQTEARDAESYIRRCELIKLKTKLEEIYRRVNFQEA